MWKWIIAFLAFAGLAMWLLSRGGDIDMGGEKHGSLHEPVQAAAPAARG